MQLKMQWASLLQKTLPVKSCGKADFSRVKEHETQQKKNL